MTFKTLKGRLLYRIMSGCCCLVREPYKSAAVYLTLIDSLRLLLCMVMMPAFLVASSPQNPFAKQWGYGHLPQDRGKNDADVLYSIQLAHMLSP